MRFLSVIATFGTLVGGISIRQEPCNVQPDAFWTENRLEDLRSAVTPLKDDKLNQALEKMKKKACSGDDVGAWYATGPLRTEQSAPRIKFWNQQRVDEYKKNVEEMKASTKGGYKSDLRRMLEEMQYDVEHDYQASIWKSASSSYPAIKYFTDKAKKGANNTVAQ